MKVVDVLKKLGIWENVCIRPKDRHPHDLEAITGVAEDVLKEHAMHLALKRPVYRITTGEWEGCQCIFIIYK